MSDMRGLAGVWAAVAALLLAGAAVAAEPRVGLRAPEIRAREWLNAPGPTSLAQLRGQVVVVEFWATWCAPCRQSIPHIDALARKWADKGLTVLGLTREGRSTVENFFRGQKRQVSYTIGCGSDSGTAYGVRGIPHAFVIDPDGIVAWAGHPMSGLDEAVEKALGPVGEPTTAPASQPSDADLAAAMEALNQDEFADALRILEGVVRSSDDEARSRRASELMARVLEVGEARADQANALVKEKKYVEAAELLRGLAEQFADTEVGRKARLQLMGLRRRPEVSAAIRQEQWQQEADAMLARADDLAAQKRYALAADRYRLVTMLYGRTDAGRKARQKMRQLESDEQIGAQIKEQRAVRRAVGWLSIARSYARIGRDTRAKTFYKKIVDAYPGTRYAEDASREMQDLPR